jgi:hypothetical protein
VEADRVAPVVGIDREDEAELSAERESDTPRVASMPERSVAPRGVRIALGAKEGPFCMRRY